MVDRKCDNYELCCNMLPNWWYSCKGNWMCTNCHMSFGTWGSGENKHVGRGSLIFEEGNECPVCLEEKKKT